jgi:hypothetical protein
MPILFHLYFLENFNLYLFSINNESIIRDYYIENYSRTFDNKLKLDIIDDMLSFFFTITQDTKYLSILNYSDNTLLKLFDKIIPEYLYATYSLNPEVRTYKSKKIINYIKQIKHIIEPDTTISTSILRPIPTTSNQLGFRFIYDQS